MATEWIPSIVVATLLILGEVVVTLWILGRATNTGWVTKFQTVFEMLNGFIVIKNK